MGTRKNIKKKDLICKLIETFSNDKNLRCTVRHIYNDKHFKLIGGLKEMKSFKKKVLIKKSDKDLKYEYRYLWLCYEISSQAKCDCCGEICSKYKLQPYEEHIEVESLNVKTGTKNDIHRVRNINLCPRCAYQKNLTNNTEACMNCKDRVCNMNIKSFKELVEIRKSTEKLSKELENKNFSKKNKKGKRK